MHTTTLQELAELTEAKLLPGTVPLPETIEGFADLMSATETDVSFYGNAAYLPKVRKTKAAAVFVPHDFDEPMASARLIVENPSVAFAIAVDQLSLPLHKFEAGIHPSAQVHPTAQVDTSTVCVDAGAVIAEGVCVGAGSYIGQGVSLDRGVSLGDSCQILANASIREHCLLGHRIIVQPGAVIGSDGFGFEMVDGRHQKIEQRGIVQIDDDVEVGANATIDRARFGKTWIQEGTKIDNLVQIGHNARIGKHCIVVALTGIAGSAIIGDHVVIAAQSGVAGHLEIGSKSTLAARSGVTKSLPGGQIYAGYPAMPAEKHRKITVMQRRLEKMQDRISSLEKG
ncbi:MAG: UDP-3-O-(3-hydroxymyristoyl)glucosamine N-acyltransferase [Verrucomicrobiales bacterium]|jgi:UDP-3-O-[3-hydroxymyristoyl] glucosamine N-acyltransferase|nr:UDP-3-O-(3-hydroxymyristoyl)glucosamine N-acyltransferase [Verrucomicrobiales bacterium]MDB2347959.1 UDP-3-O-(3-hydroxymyristoyl)glucosamine N-acyltransferase [Verrucomicrobiales bacterium]MDB4789346.1 UDP-3-O-(3-hydroxymyristoyl)glucosamine N-acyltransferase [Verrucomicrobiales bacterium]MDF1786906.1 UDP-3-O-(3-hydroxymyristoyl)glucosamine N-acyltransferase [Verrucomicrobiales bacterium]